MPTAPPTHRPVATRAAWTKAPGADAARLSGRPWRRLRLRILERDKYLCAACWRSGLVTRATEVDHVRPVASGGDDSDANLQSLCARCHGIKTALEGGAVGARSHPDWLPQPACAVVLVTGPPGGGKSTYAAQCATVADTVIDLDECFRDVCGVHGHTADRVHLSAAIRWRNRQLADLARKTTGRAYFIVGAPSAGEVEWWRARLSATHVLCDPGQEVCLSRVSEARRGAVTYWYDCARRNEWAKG